VAVADEVHDIACIRDANARGSTAMGNDRLVAGALLDNVPGAIYRSDWGRGYAIELITDHIERITGYPASSFLDGTRTLWDVIHPDDRGAVLREAGDAAGEERPFAIEYRVMRPDGAHRWVLDRGQIFHGPGGETWMDGVLFDITQRREEEARRLKQEAEAARAEELQASRARIVAAADAARRRIERDLHDGAQQELVAVALGLRLARNRLDDDDPAQAAPLLDAVIDQLAHALAELRELARGIHPATLTEHGLTPAIHALTARAPLPVAVVAMPSERLPPAVEAALYFTCAEALANVARYARAKEATVRISTTDREVAVEIADDGVGGADPGSGSGLRGLIDRVAALDGRLEIDSPPGAGTRLRAVVPLTRAGT
jgi:PAS domain S-box-containing protein